MLGTIWKHEMRLLAREPRFWIPFLLPALVLLASQIWILGMPGMHGSTADPRLLHTLGAMMAVMGSTLAADSFAGERERNTLEVLLSLPVSVATIFHGKLLAILSIPVVLGLGSQALMWAAFPGLPLPILVGAFAVTLAVAFASTSFALLVSLRAQSVRAAAQTAAVLVILVLAGVQVGHEWLLQTPWHGVQMLLLALVLGSLAYGRGLKVFTRGY